MKVLRNRASNWNQGEIVEMTNEQIVDLLKTKKDDWGFIVTAPDKNDEYELEITDYDCYVE